MNITVLTHALSLVIGVEEAAQDSNSQSLRSLQKRASDSLEDDLQQYMKRGDWFRFGKRSDLMQDMEMSLLKRGNVFRFGKRSFDNDSNEQEKRGGLFRFGKKSSMDPLQELSAEDVSDYSNMTPGADNVIDVETIERCWKVKACRWMLYLLLKD